MQRITPSKFCMIAFASVVLLATSIVVPISLPTVDAWPVGCNLGASYYSGQLPEAPGGSAAGVYVTTCGGYLSACSAGIWQKGQWLTTQGIGARHFNQSSACFTLNPGVTYANTRAQCADYTGGFNYASCHQRYV